MSAEPAGDDRPDKQLSTPRFEPAARRALDLAFQFLLIAVAYTAWRYARGAVGGGGGAEMVAAFEHARDLISVERWLHTLIEVDVQRWAVDTGWPADFTRWMYANAHFKGSLLALGFVFFFRRDSFAFLRNMMFCAMAISIVLYAIYPTAPPRFIGELGLDGSTSVTGNNPFLVKPGDPLFNPFAAVPSMHVGFATMFGWILAFLVRPRLLKALLFGYPLLMTFVVVATGNHFWIDGLFGVFAIGLAAVAATGLGRLRPRWRFAGLPDAEPDGAGA